MAVWETRMKGLRSALVGGGSPVGKASTIDSRCATRSSDPSP